MRRYKMKVSGRGSVVSDTDLLSIQIKNPCMNPGFNMNIEADEMDVTVVCRPKKSTSFLRRFIWNLFHAN